MCELYVCLYVCIYINTYIYIYIYIYIYDRSQFQTQFTEQAIIVSYAQLKVLIRKINVQDFTHLLQEYVAFYTNSINYIQLTC